MSSILAISESLQSIGAAVASAERMVSRAPYSDASHLLLKSLLYRQRKVEAEFAQAAASSAAGVDVCRYHIDGEDLSSAANIFLALVEFQKLVTTTYSAVKSGEPRARSRFSDEDVKATNLGFSYSLAGSFIAVFTMPNEQLLLCETDLDFAMSVICEAAKATSAKDIKEFSRKYGTAVIHALYDWSEVHARFGFFADIQWQRKMVPRAKVSMQPQEFVALNGYIRSSDEGSTESRTLPGELVAVHATRKSFAFKPDGEPAISGTFVDAISQSQTVKIPGRYVAHLTCHVSTILSTGEERLAYHLERLDPLE